MRIGYTKRIVVAEVVVIRKRKRTKYSNRFPERPVSQTPTIILLLNAVATRCHADVTIYRFLRVPREMRSFLVISSRNPSLLPIYYMIV